MSFLDNWSPWRLRRDLDRAASACEYYAFGGSDHCGPQSTMESEQ